MTRLALVLALLAVPAQGNHAGSPYNDPNGYGCCECLGYPSCSHPSADCSESMGGWYGMCCYNGYKDSGCNCGGRGYAGVWGTCDQYGHIAAASLATASLAFTAATTATTASLAFTAATRGAATAWTTTARRSADANFRKGRPFDDHDLLRNRSRLSRRHRRLPAIGRCTGGLRGRGIQADDRRRPVEPRPARDGQAARAGLLWRVRLAAGHARPRRALLVLGRRLRHVWRDARME